MIAVTVKSSVKKENAEAFISVSYKHAKISLSTDEGCVRFDVAKPAENSDEIYFFEIWTSREALDKHGKRGAAGKEVPQINALRYAKSLEIFDLLD